MHSRSMLLLMLALFVGIAWAPPGEIMASPADVVVICNDSVKTSPLKKDDIREMYLGRKTRWNDGSKVVLAALRQGRTNELFMEEYVGKTPAQFLTHWNRQVFTGRGKMPAMFDTEKELVEFVKATPGAVGYVSKEESKNQVQSIPIQ